MKAQMQITVRLFGAFRSDRFAERSLVYPVGTRISEIAEQLQIPRRALGVALINGLHVAPSDVPREGDTLALLPILGGG